MTSKSALKIWWIFFDIVHLFYISKIIDKILFVIILNRTSKEILISLKGKIWDQWKVALISELIFSLF